MSTINYSASSLQDAELDAAFEESLRSVRAEDAPTEPLHIDGADVTTAQTVERLDPCTGDVVGRASAAGEDEIRRAVAAAKRAAGPWRRTAYGERLALIRAAREAYGKNLARIAAIVSAETGKTRLEAVGETHEVLDMIEHYCAQFERADGFATQQRTVSEGERNFDILRPYGVFAVIAPFNFPVALSVNMTVAALITGNTVVIKPSDKTPRSTAVVMKFLTEVLPAGVLNVVHGGATTGAQLAATDVDGIAFTGSAEVGWQLAATPSPSGLPRPLLAEMGGQNPVIVTASADLTDAASGIVRSAIGLSGQKCSGLRRIVVDRSVAGPLRDLVAEKFAAVRVGDPLDASVGMGPLIDDAISNRVDEALAAAHRDGKVLTGGRVADDKGNYFTPVLVADLPKDHPLTRQELFAPFVTVIEVDSFDEALDEANAVEYGLSAGIFSADQAEIDRFLDEIEAGITYVNRPAGATTGAWPGVQSFAGWKRSGSTGKGGLGTWYLQGFMREQNRTIVGE
ncbi:aldehyde dehydrogenase family protein [Actinoplanes bogorensis]|uniref:Aldehyde dehydrogenase family protein n=1 Tax=Paractinoplanes bogorensis TaxID=1610840 RepID=A0ABS5YXH1_9ACTN|nr:aldehyde dehydrogenase family protein [Actinoplanes bogorensis]MBU2668078.1 aldehyde dehydrogenase family protein [Actinoplanes bogorensis]